MRQSVLRIGEAGRKGLGVFANDDIPGGTVVVRYRGKARWIWDIPRGLWDRCLQVGYDRYVVPTRGSFGWFLNHSCDPNCAVGGEREIVALRRISKGEELTFDYSTNVGWDGFSMECRCGAKDCRRTIVSYWGLDARSRKKYGRKVSPYLLRTRRSKYDNLSVFAGYSRAAEALYKTSPKRTAMRTGSRNTAD